jgi:uncharacterized oxidoreductase
VHTIQCDVADTEKRQALFDWTIENFPDLNILVNNAGIQRKIDLKKGMEALKG